MVEQRRGSAHQRGYTRRWSEYSKARLRRHPLCVGYPRGYHGYTVVEGENGDEIINQTSDARLVLAEVTDHGESAAAHPELFWEPSNHQSLCTDCNKRKAIEVEGGFGRDVRG